MLNKILVFFENNLQVDFFFNSFPKEQTNIINFVALTPFAIRRLEELKKEYSYPEQYFNCEEEYKKLGIQFFEEFENIINYLDNLISNKILKFKNENLCPFECFGYHWQRLLYTIKIKIFEIVNILRNTINENKKIKTI